VAFILSITAYLLDIVVPNSHNITQTYNTKINKFKNDFDDQDLMLPTVLIVGADGQKFVGLLP
jgi:uncharacterized alpha/beta hydrolase family protein